MSNKSSGLLVSIGGVSWLVGILILELTFDEVSDDLPLSFSILAVVAGAAVGWGGWAAGRLLDGGLARFGMRSVAVCSFALGAGFGLDLVEGLFLGFLLAYSVGLFVLPAAFVVLGVGVMRSRVYPAWARWVPFAVAGVAVVTYAFHALGREVWDPSDAVWYVALGVGWVLLGLAIAGFQMVQARGESAGRVAASG